MAHRATNPRPPPGAGARPAWRLRIARRIQGLSWSFTPVAKVAEQFQAAIPVGLLRREEIDRMVQSTYRGNPDYYHPAHYTARHEERILPALKRHAPARDGGRARLLDLYCGHGREAEIFARAGYNVTGVDALPEVIDRAREYAKAAGFDAEFIAADIDEWQPAVAAWDVVYTSLWMYSTVPGRAERIAWVARLMEWAAPDGVLVVSVKPRTSALGSTVRHLIARLTAGLTRNQRRPERGERFTSGLFWRDCTPEEVAAELRAAHADILDVVDVDHDMRCVLYVVRARRGGR